MTDFYLTIDTEYDFSFTRRLGPDTRAANFDRSIACNTKSGPVGIAYQMDVLDRNGLKGVFFVDPMPALLWGVSAIEDIIGPIIARGHDVQLHIHTEWLELAGSANPLGTRTGLNIKDFTFDEQCSLLSYAQSVLIAAGAPAPVAFRAGNYGANDETLLALALIGLRYDTNHSPGFAKSHCAISLTPADCLPSEHCGMIEVPIGAIGERGGRLRHAQLTAVSAAETLSAIRHCQRHHIDQFTLVSHSFELLSRDRSRVNKVVRHRFESLCRKLGTMPGVTSATYAANPPKVAGQQAVPTPRYRPLHAGLRIAEQALANTLYGSS